MRGWPPFNPLAEGVVPFDRVAAALQFAADELAAGRAVLLWPIDHEGYVVAVRSGERIQDVPQHDPFAPTVSMGLETRRVERASCQKS